MDKRSSAGLIGGLLGAAAVAVLLVPFEKKETEEGYKLTAVAYELEYKKDGENKNYHFSACPLIKKQTALCKELFNKASEQIKKKRSGDEVIEDFEDIADDLEENL